MRGERKGGQKKERRKEGIQLLQCGQPLIRLHLPSLESAQSSSWHSRGHLKGW